MSINRPSVKTPELILAWLNKERDSRAVHAYLTELRQTDYSRNLDLNKPAHAIVHALTTNNVNSINPRKLRAAILGVDPSQILAVILALLELLLKYLESTDVCNKKKQAAKQQFIDQLKALGPNPFTNLPKIHLSYVDLTGVNLTGANLKGAKFTSVNLNYANLQDANLRDADFIDSRFKGCTLTNANVCWTNLANASDLTCPRNIALKPFLQTNYPQGVRLETFPTINELTNALNDIHNELASERLSEHDPLRSIQRKMDRHRYHLIMARNIEKIANQITDPQLGYDMMKAVINHHVFTAHLSARFTKSLNNMVMHMHDMFFTPKKQTPYFGTIAQDILIHHLKIFEEQLIARQHQAPRPA